VLSAADLTLGIIEDPRNSNAGYAVERIQRTAGGAKGEAWCASHVYTIGAGMFGKRWPLPRTRSCDVLLEFARKKKILRTEPARGAVFLLMRKPHDAIHTGFVTGEPKAGVWPTNEGNTNDGGSRDGYGVFARQRGGKADAAIKAGLSYTFIYWWELL
jgi:hypothetical protein